MSFAVAAEAYDRFVGRYSVLLSPQLADLAGVRGGQRVLDVGCGPGALTNVLVRRVGPEAVAAVDPSEQFVSAARARNPGVDVRQGSAEQLPFSDNVFDAALAQLVVHFMSDPAAGLAEMRRVTRQGGVVAACVWDHGGGRGPLTPLWEAVRNLDAGAAGESDLAGSREGGLTGLFEAVGLGEVEEKALSVRVEHPTFEEWWDPSPSASAPRAHMSPGSMPSGGRSCASTAAPCFPMRRSCSRRGLGRPAASRNGGQSSASALVSWIVPSG